MSASPPFTPASDLEGGVPPSASRPLYDGYDGAAVSIIEA